MISEKLSSGQFVLELSPGPIWSFSWLTLFFLSSVLDPLGHRQDLNCEHIPSICCLTTFVKLFWVGKLFFMHSWSFQVFSSYYSMSSAYQAHKQKRKTLSQKINSCNYIPLLTRVCARAKSEISDSLLWGLLEHSSLSCRSLSVCVYPHRFYRHGKPSLIPEV